MIDYTLTWLESAGVEEVYVFCCAHSKQVIDYLENSEWFGLPNFSVSTIESHNATSAGDALRLIYERNVVSCSVLLTFFSDILIFRYYAPWYCLCSYTAYTLTGSNSQYLKAHSFLHAIMSIMIFFLSTHVYYELINSKQLENA